MFPIEVQLNKPCFADNGRLSSPRTRASLVAYTTSTSPPDLDVHEFLKNLTKEAPPAPQQPRAVLTYEGGRLTDDEFAVAMESIGLPREKATTLVLGVSGGADSMALALLAKRWTVRNGSKLVACIVNHGFRVPLLIAACIPNY